MQNELAVAGNHDASIEQIKTFVQRRCQYAQLMPTTSNAQPFNQIGVQQPPNQGTSSTNNQSQHNREVKRKFDGQCRNCGIHGHKWAECRKRLSLKSRTQQNRTNQNQQQTTAKTKNQETEPKHNTKLICQICGKLGHCACDCYYRNTTTSAYRNVPETKQSTDESKQFRKDFRQANHRTYTTNELSHAYGTINVTEDPEETDGAVTRRCEGPKNF